MTEEQEQIFTEWFNAKKFIIQYNGKVRDAGNRPVATKAILTAWKALKGFNENYFAIDDDDIDAYVASHIPVKEEVSDGKPTAQDLMLNFTGKFLDEFELRIESNTPIIFKKGGLYNEQVGLKDAAKETRIALIQQNIPCPKLEEATSYVEQIYREFVRNQREEALRKIMYNPDVKGRGFKFVDWTNAVFNKYGIVSTKLNRKMWRYFIHSTKRAAFGLKPNDLRIFFLIYSRTQGIGKSRLLAHICDPFKYAFNNAVTLGDFLDKSSVKALTKGAYALLDFQELGMGKQASSVSAVDLGALMKRVITLDVEKGRELYTTTDTASLMNMVFASSTNLHISDVIQDTEYRRYFSFDSTLTRDEAIDRDWSEIDEFFDSTLIDAYQFLDENEVPTLGAEMEHELHEVQLTYSRRTDIITLWLRDMGMELVDSIDGEVPDNADSMERSKLYRIFSRFVSKNGFKQMSVARMSQLISTSKDILPQDKSDGKSYYYLRKVSDEE